MNEQQSDSIIENHWEMFRDPSHYDMWAVRDIWDKSFASPRLFHFYEKEDAEQFFKLIQKSK